MQTTEAIIAIQAAAVSSGYRHRDAMYWKHSGELTTMIHVQRSRWGPGFYVNFGVIPSRMVTRKKPPGPEYWPFGERADSCESPYKEQFRALAVGEDIGVTEDYNAAFAWLVDWIDRHLSDAVALRASILDPESWISRRAPMTEGILGDWARGELKEASHYNEPLSE